MTFNEAKLQIHSAVTGTTYPYPDDDNDTKRINQLVTSCILYEFLSSMAETNPGIETTLMSTASSYATQYYGITKTFQQKYVAYSLMRIRIRQWGYPQFTAVTLSQAEEIISYYHDKTEIVKFSAAHYSQYMYNIGNLTKKQNDRMRSLHFSVMVPIMQYFMNQDAGLKASDIAIYGIDSVPSNPGKEIIFRIGDIPIAKLIFAIKNNVGVWSKLRDAEHYNGYVKITTR